MKKVWVYPTGSYEFEHAKVYVKEHCSDCKEVFGLLDDFGVLQRLGGVNGLVIHNAESYFMYDLVNLLADKITNFDCQVILGIEDLCTFKELLRLCDGKFTVSFLDGRAQVNTENASSNLNNVLAQFDKLKGDQEFAMF